MLTHQRVAEAAATLSPAVAEEGADVEGQEDDPHGRPDHQILEPELARVGDCIVAVLFKVLSLHQLYCTEWLCQSRSRFFLKLLQLLEYTNTLGLAPL